MAYGKAISMRTVFFLNSNDMDHYQLLHLSSASTDETAGFAAAIGFFDGVHQGHRHVLGRLRSLAAERGLRTLVITFEEHPRRVLGHANAPDLLTTNEEKLQLLAECGMDACVMLRFSKEMAGFTARQFMDEYLSRQLGVRTLLIGYDHHFGRPQKGEGFEQYAEYGRELGIEVLNADQFLAKDAEVALSSSTIRTWIAEGRVAETAAGLGRPYSLVGTIVEGRQNGRKLGFPTANLRVNHPAKLIPALGVYATRVVVDGKEYGAMTNVGRRPTLDNGMDITIESYLFDVDMNLYGRTLELRFIERLRDEMRFPSLEALQAQLHEDAQHARQCLSGDK